jgi:hypothetical protein
VKGKYIIFTQIEYVNDIDVLDISKCKVVVTDDYYETKEDAIDEMILKLLEIRNKANYE